MKDWESWFKDRRDQKQLLSCVKHRHVRRICQRTPLTAKQARQFIKWARENHPKITNNTNKHHSSEIKEEVSVRTDPKNGSLLASWQTKTIRTPEELMKVAGIEEGTWTVYDKSVKKWDSQLADNQGVIEMFWVQVRAQKKAAWATDSMKTQPYIKRTPKPRGKDNDWEESCLVLPDSQNGYRWSEQHDRLDCMHSRECWDIAVQVAYKLQPDNIILLGDMLDNPELSMKFPQPIEVRDTLAPALHELHWWMRKLREACPHAKIIFLEGNHEERLTRLMVERASSLQRVRPPGDPDGAPLFSMERMLSLDSIDVEYVAPYGASYPLWDLVEVSHGTTVAKGGGATVARVIKGSSVSKIFGHIHRQELAWKTLHEMGKERRLFVMSPGSMTSTAPGVVPGFTAASDWQQGFAVLYKDGDQVHPQMVSVLDGTCMWDGKMFVGRDRGKEIANDTGWAALGPKG